MSRSPKTNSPGAGIVIVSFPVPEDVAQEIHKQAHNDNRSLADYLRSCVLKKEHDEGDLKAVQKIQGGLYRAYPRARALWGCLKAVFTWNGLSQNPRS